ncbi:MAG: 2Fe-2S iron-sulfur cluster-binding protein [Pseudomonadales bacterium]
MPTVTFIEPNGAEHTVTADSGATLMEAAVNNDVPRIDADCGGACACGTCHVKIDETWIEKLDQRTVEEESMLSLAVDVTDASRLSCQITLSEELDSLRVYLPDSQY